MIVGAGSAGTFAVTAQATSVASNVASGLLTLTGSGVIYYSSDEAHAVNSDPDGVVADAVDFIVTTNYVYALASTGKWYVKAGAHQVNPYKEITGVPALDSVWGGKGSDYGYALAGGNVYATAATTTGYQVNGAAGVVEIATTGARTFARTSGGEVYRVLDGLKSFTQVTKNTDGSPLTGVTDIDGNQGGGYGWEISGTDIYFILDNNQASVDQHHKEAGESEGTGHRRNLGLCSRCRWHGMGALDCQRW